MKRLKEGTIKRIHVNKQVISQNLKYDRDDPAITIQTSHGPFRARKVYIRGPSVFVQSLEAPLSSGARLWCETTAAVEYK